jgi:hypothetical protein
VVEQLLERGLLLRFVIPPLVMFVIPSFCDVCHPDAAITVSSSLITFPERLKDLKDCPL